VSGACLLARAESVLEVGPFDENIIIYYEDVDWCYRMVQAGWKVVFYPDAGIIHYYGETRKKNMARDTFVIYQSRKYFFSKHYSLMAQLLVKILTIIEVSLLYLRTLISSHLFADQRHDLLKTYRQILKLTLIPSASPFIER
jgi:GT2 family glycosyltransferase